MKGEESTRKELKRDVLHFSEKATVTLLALFLKLRPHLDITTVTVEKKNESNSLSFVGTVFDSAFTKT